MEDRRPLSQALAALNACLAAISEATATVDEAYKNELEYEELCGDDGGGGLRTVRSSVQPSRPSVAPLMLPEAPLEAHRCSEMDAKPSPSSCAIGVRTLKHGRSTLSMASMFPYKFDDLDPTDCTLSVGDVERSPVAKRMWSTGSVPLSTGDTKAYHDLVIRPIWQEKPQALLPSRSAYPSKPSQSQTFSPRVTKLRRVASQLAAGKVSNLSGEALAESEHPSRSEDLDRLSKLLAWNPEDKGRITWDVLGMLLILYDVIVMPLQVFAPAENNFVLGMSFVTLVFWTIDIPFSFITGYHKRGVVEMSLRKIIKNYLMGCFFFDVALVGSDWAITMLTEYSNSSVSQLRIGRALRFLRMMRLVRLVKVQGKIREFIDSIRSESCLILLGITKLLVFIMVVNHLLACAWFGIGIMGSSNNAPNWVESFYMEDRGMLYQYLTALHWSCTQFTPASMEVVPKNAAERLFNVITLMFAMVTFSSFVSSITNAMTRLRNLNLEKSQQHALLRRYLVENDIPLPLVTRVWGFVEHMQRGLDQQHIRDRDVPILRRLPAGLRAELQDEVFLPVLAKHAFFSAFKENYPRNLQRIYKEALEEVSLDLGQELFNAGQKARAMIFVVRGGLIFCMQDCDECDVGDGQWLCEAALWVEWYHCGHAIASKHSDLLFIKAAAFQRIIQREMSGVHSPARYAAAFVDHFNDQGDILTDVWCDNDVTWDLACGSFEKVPSLSPPGPPLRASLRASIRASIRASNFSRS